MNQDPEKDSKPALSHDSPADRALGMNQEITRRDFLNATLVGSGSLLLHPLSPAQLLAKAHGADASEEDDWTGYGGVGDYSKSNGNTMAVMEAGHQIRDGAFETLPPTLIETKEIYDLVGVGGGISGLARSDLSPAGGNEQSLSRTRQSSHLRRRGQAQ